MRVDMLDEARLDIIITDYMLDMGVPAHLKGYQYLREALGMTILDFEVATSVTKLMYPQIARRFHTTDQKVERAIRNAIEVSWIRGNDDTEQKLFGYTKENNIRPTNSEYIAKLADKIRMDIKMMPEAM